MTGPSKPAIPTTSDRSIRVGNLTNATGVAIGHGAQARVEQLSGGMSDELVNLFARLAHQVNALPDGPDKSAAASALQGLEIEAAKGDQAEEHSVNRWFNFLAQTAPDAWEVAVDAFLNPIKGLSTAFKKIAQRAQAARAEQQ
ncbi:MAG TPA: hypothetical protein VJG32_13800 [Anaerolineae bacterium]|nr:hypothetical protein [Anaerolineae bacterium]